VKAHQEGSARFTLREAVCERHRVGLVGSFLAGCWFQWRSHLPVLVGFGESQRGLGERVETHVSAGGGMFVVLFGQ